MGKLFFDITTSLDGFVAGPNPSREHPLGEGGERLHEWVVAVEPWRKAHGKSGGERNVDAEVVQEALDATGAVIMGRKMFSGGEGPWDDDPNADGWWGDDPPFHVPVFVLTHHPRETKGMKGGTTFTFVTDGIQSALEQAQAAAGDRDVAISGGASAIQQYLEAELVDEFQIHVAPVLLGSGTRLLDGQLPKIGPTRVIESPAVAHLRYRVEEA